MKKADLKRYLLLSNGNQVDQKITPINKNDLLEKDNKVYLFYEDNIINGTKGSKYRGIQQVIYTCKTEKTLLKHMKQLFTGGEIYFDAIKQCIAAINANCEYHMREIEEVYKANNSKKDFKQDRNYLFYDAQHLAMEQLKKQMAWQLVWRNNNIEYLGQGGCLAEREWYDDPFELHKTTIKW